MNCTRNAGLWCSWILYAFITCYLLWATGISWSHVFFSLTYGPDFTVQMIISSILLIILITLMGITVFRFSKSLMIDRIQTKKYMFISIGIYSCLVVLEFLFQISPIFQYILDNIATRAWLLTLINTIFDWTRLIAVIFCLIYFVKFTKHKKIK